MLFNGPDNQGMKKKWLSLTTLYFYGSAKIEQKIKVCLMENKGSVDSNDDQSES